MGQFEQCVVVEAERRTLEDHRQVEVVVGQEGKVTQGRQVHDRQLIGEDHAVGAGHRDAPFLEAAHHLFGERGALAQKDHDVAGAHRAARRFENFALVQPAANVIGDAARQKGRRAFGGDLVEGRVPGIGGRLYVGRHRRPQLDQAGLAVAR